MAQNLDVVAPIEHYTRNDYTALRAYLNNISIDFIVGRYYDWDDLERLGCTTVSDVKHRLERLCDQLTQRAVVANPHVATVLKEAWKKRVWSKGVQDFLFQALTPSTLIPKPSDSLSLWFRSNVSAALRSDGIKTLSDLIKVIQIRGRGWFKPIPRIGEGKAKGIYQWLSAFPEFANQLPDIAKEKVLHYKLVELESDHTALAPLERISLNHLDGSAGLNRAEKFCLVSARNDLQAIEAYLYKFREQDKTRRAYQKELERFLLWCVQVRKLAMSSVLVGDCEAYKDFLSNVPPEWCGIRKPRNTTEWRPFVSTPSPASRRYAIQVIRAFFEWLVKIRYLGGNPWVAVSDPPVAKAINPIQIEKAMPEHLWEKLIQDGGILDLLSEKDDAVLRDRYKLRGAASKFSMSAQYRLVRAALLLMGDSGLRREEVATATRNLLKPSTFDREVWELDVLGKRNKWRTVFCSQRTIEALRKHWQDRELEFEFGISEIPLISPLIIPGTEDSIRKHLTANGEARTLAYSGADHPVRTETGFAPDGLYKAIRNTLNRISEDEDLDLEPLERQTLRDVSPHSFRHTFGTMAVAADTPIDVVQKVLGHASLQTTTIYVQSEKRRSVRELGAFFKKKTN